MRIGPRPATFERWTAEDEVLLQAMLDAKTDLDLIARKLKRSRPAIHKRINVLRKKREHASLAGASPSVGSTISVPPQEVMLTFTERLEPAFSKLTVIDATGAEVSQGKVQVNDAQMRIGLKPLSAGIYKVNWRAVSSDTHKVEGSFTFRVGSQ